MEQLDLIPRLTQDAECECVNHWIMPEPHNHFFDGSTYEPPKDRHRLNAQLRKVFDFMREDRSLAAGKWHSLREIADAVGGSESGVSARLRDFRKLRFGAHTVERRRVDGGLFQYRLVANGELK